MIYSFIRSFLINQYNDDLNLCSEAPIAAPNVYWLLNDNLDVATVLQDVAPSRCYRILRELFDRDVMANGVIEAFHGQPIPWPPLLHSFLDIEDNRPNYFIRTEIRDGPPMTSWMQFGDLIAFRAIGLHNEGDTAGADALLDNLFAMWDGTGIVDTVQQNALDNRYASFKLGLLLLAADTVGKPVPFRTAIEDRLGTVQRTDGGIVTDYLPDGTPFGDANVETTSISLMGLLGQGLLVENLVVNAGFELEALPPHGGAPLDWFHSENGWAWSNTVSRSGTHSIVLDDQSDATGADWRSLTFRVTPGERLRATFFHQQTITEGGIEYYIRFFEDAAATQFISQVGGVLTESNTEFEPLYLFDIMVPNGAAWADIHGRATEPIALTDRGACIDVPSRAVTRVRLCCEPVD